MSLWLGHASIQNTEIFLRADPTEKLDALAMGVPPALKRDKFQVPDKLMAMFKEAKKPMYLCKVPTVHCGGELLMSAADSA